MVLRIRGAPMIAILCGVSDSQVSDDRLTAVAAELGRLGRRLDDLGVELLALRSSSPGPAPGGGSGAGPGDVLTGPSGVGAAPAPDRSGPPAWPAPPTRPGPPGVAGTPGAAAAPRWVAPGPVAPQGPWPGRPPRAAASPAVFAGTGAPWTRPGPAVPTGPPAPQRPGWWASLSGARLLAWTGGGVTLLGLVMLLVLAASRGWFSPVARLVAGAVLGLALLGLAVWLHRKESARAGAVAVAGTGVAALYLVVASGTAQYHYLPAAVGLVLGLVVAAGGLGLADHWRSPALAIGAVVGAGLLMPVVTEGWGPLLAALTVVLEIVAGIVALRRGWPWLLVVGAAWAVLYASLAAGVAGSAELWPAGAAAAAVLVVGCALALYALVTSSTNAPAYGVLASAAVPMLVMGGRLDGWRGAAVAGGAAVVMLGVALVPRLDRPVRIVALTVGAVALLEATGLLFSGDVGVAVIVGEGIGFAVAAALLRSRPTLLFAAGFGVMGVLGALALPLPPGVLAGYPASPFTRGGLLQTGPLVTGLIVAVLTVGLAVAMLVALARTGLLGSGDGRAAMWVVTGLVGLYGLTGFVVGLALLVSPDRGGFVAGHAVVTVLWTVLALVLLARGIRNTPLRVAGLVLVAAAVAKLILFDLVSLDGLARVGAFLGAGLVLLFAGVRYARLVSEAETATGPATPPTGVAAPAGGPEQAAGDDGRGTWGPPDART
ncbi:hypothetical protein PSD17_07050 [Pseudonocardia sp. D17]|nr:hypothetical protein PSD17_07050 [Pseudonocardia sp. D17]